jgi:hypothetical protein
MKKIWVLIQFLFGNLMINSLSMGQITFEHTYPMVNDTSIARPILINLGDNEFKYIYVDYATNQLKLFNLNHSSFLNVNFPIQLINWGEYTVGYVTRTLFDCDTNMLEYAIFPTNWKNSFYIYRQDGTLLFQRDSAIGPYCFGCYSGAYNIRPIVNSPAGAKLFLAKATNTGSFPSVDIYSLCGTLPINTDDEVKVPSTQFVKTYPNPSSGSINFDFQLPSNFENFELIIYNSIGEAINRIKINNSTTKYKFSNLNSGSYFYMLNTEFKLLETGKFIISN